MEIFRKLKRNNFGEIKEDFFRGKKIVILILFIILFLIYFSIKSTMIEFKEFIRDYDKNFKFNGTLASKYCKEKGYNKHWSHNETEILCYDPPSPDCKPNVCITSAKRKEVFKIYLGDGMDEQ